MGSMEHKYLHFNVVDEWNKIVYLHLKELSLSKESRVQEHFLCKPSNRKK